MATLSLCNSETAQLISGKVIIYNVRRSRRNNYGTRLTCRTGISGGAPTRARVVVSQSVACACVGDK